MVALKKGIQRCYIAFVLLLLYAPLMILIVCSFNASKARSVWGGFTLHWYRDLFHNEEVLEALKTSLLLTISAALIAAVLGTMACAGMSFMAKKKRNLLMNVTNIPLLNADIVTGIAIMLLFAHFLSLGFTSMLIAHVTLGVPYVILNVMPRMQQASKGVYEAALDLGASHLTAFMKVVLPEIFPGIAAGFFFAFTVSMDDFVVTYFTKGPGINTVSTMLYQQLRRGINPQMYALSAIFLMVILIMLGILNHIIERQDRRAG